MTTPNQDDLAFIEEQEGGGVTRVTQQAAPWTYGGFDPTFSRMPEAGSWIVPRELPEVNGFGGIDLHDGSIDVLSDPLTFVTMLTRGDFDDDALVTPDQRSTWRALMNTPISELYRRNPAIVATLVDAGVDVPSMTPTRANAPAGMVRVTDPYGVERFLTEKEANDLKSNWGDRVIVHESGESLPLDEEQVGDLTFGDLYGEDRELRRLVDGNTALHADAEQLQLGGVLLAPYDVWRHQQGGLADDSSARLMYEQYLLINAYATNADRDEEDYVQFDWDPNNPSGEVVVKKGDKVDADFRQAITSEKEGENNAFNFSSAYIPNTVTGVEQSQQLRSILSEYGLGELPGDFTFMLSGRSPLSIPYLGSREASLGAIGGDLNTLSPQALTTVIEKVAATFGGEAGDALQRMIEDRAAGEEGLEPAIGVALQALSLQDENVQAFVQNEVGKWTDVDNQTGMQFEVRVTPDWGRVGTSDYTYGIISEGTPVTGYTGKVAGKTDPGYNLRFTSGQVSNWQNDMGGVYGWGREDIIGHIIQAAESRGVPYQLVMATLHMRTEGWTEFSSATQAKSLVEGTVNTLVNSMQQYSNPALALIAGALDGWEVADALQNTGFIDPNLAGIVGSNLSTLYQLAQNYGYFNNPALQMGLTALQNNAGLAQQSPIQISTSDPAKVKEALRSAYEALLMPIDDATLDQFASQFRSAEIAAQQPRVNAYNDAIAGNRDYWTNSVQAQAGQGAFGQWLFPAADPNATFNNSYGYDGGRSARGYLHGGIDIYGEYGSPIVAPVSGKVLKSGDTGGAGGIRIWMKGDDGILYYFAHNALNYVQAGDRVYAGQWIGAIGDSGNAKGTKPHIHFEMHTNGKMNSQGMNMPGRTNPYYYLSESRATGSTVISPYDQQLGWMGQEMLSGSEALARAATYEVTMPDLAARAVQAMRDTDMYEDIYGEKPIGMSDLDYASAFSQRSAQLGGTANAEAARVGAATNSIQSMYARMLTDPDQVEESSTFRGNLYRISNSMISAMGGRR